MGQAEVLKFLVEQPATAELLSYALHKNRSSISTNLRKLLKWNKVLRVGVKLKAWGYTYFYLPTENRKFDEFIIIKTKTKDEKLFFRVFFKKIIWYEYNFRGVFYKLCRNNPEGDVVFDFKKYLLTKNKKNEDLFFSTI